jgi:hypothetical protein
MSETSHRECIAEIMGVLKKHDMAGAITVISKERAAFRYHFPTWSVVRLQEAPDGGLAVRIKSKLADFPSREAQNTANELSAHIVYQMRDIATNTFGMCMMVAEKMNEHWDVTHAPNSDFDPERSQ